MKGLVAQKTSARPSPRKAPAGPGPRKGGGALAASAAAGPGPPWNLPGNLRSRSLLLDKVGVLYRSETSVNAKT